MGKKKKTASNEEKQKEDKIPASLLNDPPTKLPYQQPEQLHESIWILRHYLSVNECRNWIAYMEEHAPEHCQQRGTRYLAERECYRLSRDDPDTAKRLFDRLATQTPLLQSCLPHGAIACNPNIRLYKYTKGMRFGKHYDDSQAVKHIGVTRYTILVYLSDCQGGGHTSFEGNIRVQPEPGLLLLHEHGDACLQHQADPVLVGTKYVLRTDLVYQITS